MTMVLAHRPPTWVAWICFVAVVAIYFAASAHKIHSFQDLPWYDAADGTALFWTENAFHYRHFLMVSQGEGIPALDTVIQHPEGLDTGRYVTAVMERVSGTLHRLFFSGVAPHVFLVWFIGLFSSLSVFAAFLAGRALWRSPWAGLGTAALYAALPATFIRTTIGGYLREDFALPFLYCGTAALLSCLRRDSWGRGALAGGLLLVGLACWHAAPFYLLLLLATLAVLAVWPGQLPLPTRALSAVTGLLTVGAFVLPVLRAKLFFVSPHLLLAVALTAIAWLRRPDAPSSSARRRALEWGLLLALPLATLLAHQALGSYSHVYGLLANKLRFLGTLPADPTLLSFESRVMWRSSFVSPSLANLWLLFSGGLVLLAAGVGRFVWSVVRHQTRPQPLVAVVSALGTLFLTLLVVRTSVFAAFHLALLAGGLVVWKDNRLRVVGATLVALCVVGTLVGNRDFRPSAERPSEHSLRSLLRFLKEETAPEDAVLGPFALGPSIAVYADRPIVLHPKFESPQLRDKVAAFYAALYEDEEAFYEFCQRVEARYVVHRTEFALSTKPGSSRYIAGRKRLPGDAIAARMHFAPFSLRHFHLVYEQIPYRVFQVGPPAPAAPPAQGYRPDTELALFGGEALLTTGWDDADLLAGLARLGESDTHRTLGDEYAAEERWRVAEIAYRTAVQLDRKNAPAWRRLARALRQRGEMDSAAEAIRRARALTAPGQHDRPHGLGQPDTR